MKAIISDIHGNLEALQAVLADIDAQGVEEVYCLGDVIGYGPNPLECIDLVMQRCRVCLLGNHDQAALFDPDGFNPGAFRAILWTRKLLESANDPQNERRWLFLSELPRTLQEDDCLFVHASARNPIIEYVFPADIVNELKMENLFAAVPGRSCFQGHTHIPGIFTEEPNFFAPESFDFTFRIGEEKVLVNVGSVGQPRDGDNRASYVLFDPPAVTFRRVEYDFKTTAAKIFAIPDLDDFQGTRLREGR